MEAPLPITSGEGGRTPLPDPGTPGHGAGGPRPDGPVRRAPDRAPIEIDARARLEILGAVLIGLFLAALDQTVVGTALPRIVTDLRGSDLYTWVVTIYLLTSTISGPIYGKLSDLFGRKPLLVGGIALFMLGSFLSGLSQEMWQLVLFRGIQGLGAGALFPIALAVIGDLFSPAERGKYQGLFGAVFGLSALIGPALGGFLTDVVSWPWVFFINLPIGAVTLAVIVRTLPTISRPDASRRIDYLGAAVFSLAIVPILVGLTNKQTGEWTDPLVGGLILLGLPIVALFVWVESRAPEPIVPLDLFRNRTFTISVIGAFLSAIGFFAAILFLPRWFQVVAGASATESGYQILPLLAGLIGSAVVSGQLVSRTGRYRLLVLASLILLAAGLFLLTNLRADTPTPVLWAWMLVTGMGAGPTLAVLTLIVQNAVSFEKLGAATSSLTFFRQIGGSVGLALAGTIFGSSLREELPRQLVTAGVPRQFVDQLGGRGPVHLDQIAGVGDLGQAILAAVPPPFRAVVEPLIPNIVAGVHQAFSIATANTFALGVWSSLIAAAFVLFLREVPLHQTWEDLAAQPADAAPRPAELGAE